jgi:hypothetical protein
LSQGETGLSFCTNCVDEVVNTARLFASESELSTNYHHDQGQRICRSSKCIAANVQKICTKKPGVYVRRIQPSKQASQQPV